MTAGQIVSFDDEKLILVDHDDNVVGYENKDVCHQGDGLLHRAFSILVFNDRMELLLQQRAEEKPLWGGFWSNTCCSHPRKGEDMEVATRRRLKEELGLTLDLKYLYKFTYQARFEEKGSEHELCYVYIGKTGQKPSINPTEISDWRYVPIAVLEKELHTRPEKYTPWFRMEWEHIRREYQQELDALQI